jgi:putative cardiolipin synthase
MVVVTQAHRRDEHLNKESGNLKPLILQRWRVTTGYDCFVTRDKAVETVKDLTERAVRVRVLTNSLASNDVVAAHAGRAKCRDPLIEAGLELYEYHPD